MHVLKIASLIIIAISPVIAAPLAHENRSKVQAAEDAAKMSLSAAMKIVKGDGRLSGNQDALKVVYDAAKGGSWRAKSLLKSVTNKQYEKGSGSSLVHAGPASGVAADVFKAVRNGSFGGSNIFSSFLSKLTSK